MTAFEAALIAAVPIGAAGAIMLTGVLWARLSIWIGDVLDVSASAVYFVGFVVAYFALTTALIWWVHQ